MIQMLAFRRRSMAVAAIILGIVGLVSGSEDAAVLVLAGVVVLAVFR